MWKLTWVSDPGPSWPSYLLLLFSLICFDSYLTAIKIIGVDNDAKSPPTLQITEDMGSNGTKLNESVSLYTKMTESPQGNDSFSPKTI